MSLELPEVLRQALAANPLEPLRILDAKTQTTYVVLSEAAYEQVKGWFEEDDPLEGIDVGRLANKIMREEDEGDPHLDSYQEYRKVP